MIRLVPLGDVLHRSTDTVALRPDGVYREVTVRLWGKGVVERRTATGAEMAGARRFVVKPGLNLTNIRSLAVPLPSLEQQHGIVHQLDNLWTRTNALGLHQSAVREELDALLPSILDKAFKGEL